MAAELASEAARAEGASPTLPLTAAGASGSRAGGQGRMGAPWVPARRRGAGHSPLTAGQLALVGTTDLPAILASAFHGVADGRGLSVKVPS
jgi:hypothetical protein